SFHFLDSIKRFVDGVSCFSRWLNPATARPERGEENIERGLSLPYPGFRWRRSLGGGRKLVNIKDRSSQLPLPVHKRRHCCIRTAQHKAVGRGAPSAFPTSCSKPFAVRVWLGPVAR